MKDEHDAAVNAKARAAAAKLTEQLFPGKLASDMLTPVRSGGYGASLISKFRRIMTDP